MSKNGALLTIGVMALLAAGGAIGSPNRSRDDLPDSDFVFPRGRKYPIQDRKHGRLALTYATWSPTSRKDLPAVKRAVFRRYPALIGWWNDTPWVQEHPTERVTGRRVA